MKDSLLKYGLAKDYNKKTWKQFVKSFDLQGWIYYALTCLLIWHLASGTFFVAHADNFTDIFYTQSFRGSFNWLEKLDWIGMIMQAVISIFSVLGVSLVAMRIMTSILYLSSKGLWDEVSDLKESGGESEYFDLGLINMAKSWAKGKAGTGLDAIIGAVLILLPNVKRYSDFGPNAGGKFEEDLSVTQYMLKIALPTVMIVFFCAMGFNGTMWQALATTVDALGTVADKVVSVNYAGFVDDLVASGSGYKFTYSATGTKKGEFQQNLAKDLYGRAVSRVPDATQKQLTQIGVAVTEKVAAIVEAAPESSLITSSIQGELGDDGNDSAWGYLGYDIIINAESDAASGETGEPFPMSDLAIGTEYVAGSGGDGETSTDEYVHVFVKQTRSFAGGYFNTGDVD